MVPAGKLQAEWSSGFRLDPETKERLDSHMAQNDDVHQRFSIGTRSCRGQSKDLPGGSLQVRHFGEIVVARVVIEVHRHYFLVELALD